MHLLGESKQVAPLVVTNHRPMLKILGLKV